LIAVAKLLLDSPALPLAGNCFTPPDLETRIRWVWNRYARSRHKHTRSVVKVERSRSVDSRREDRVDWRYLTLTTSESNVDDTSATHTFIFARPQESSMSVDGFLPLLAQAGLLGTELGQLLVVLIGMLVVLVVGRLVLKIAWRLVTIGVVVVGAALILTQFGVI